MNHRTCAILGMLLQAGALFSATTELSVFFKNLSNADVSVWIGASSGEATGVLKHSISKLNKKPLYLGKIREDQSFFYSYIGYGRSVSTYQKSFDDLKESAGYQEAVLLELATKGSRINWVFDLMVKPVDLRVKDPLFEGRQDIRADYSATILVEMITDAVYEAENIDSDRLDRIPDLFVAAGVQEDKTHELSDALQTYTQLLNSGLLEKLRASENDGKVENAKQLQLMLDGVRRRVLDIMRRF